ncbi:MAG TPA: hypothetical protein VNQ73_16070 [Ilumatobacter sp.]|nr:hypothetical protein [Ilumatobacter sp.]
MQEPTNPIARRGFLAGVGAGAVVPAAVLVGGKQLGEGAAEQPAGVVTARALASGRVTQIQLPETKSFSSSRQEGAKTVIAGSFTPEDDTVVIDVDIAASFGGWGAGYFDFHIGVLPDPAPEPWEPGGDNRIVLADNVSRTPLPGVTEYHHDVVGLASANTLGAHVRRQIVLGDLTIGREYQWELRCGGMSFFKEYTFPEGAQPKLVTTAADDLYAWVSCVGNHRLALVQLGWSELWNLFGQSQEMLCIAEIQLAGEPGRPALQPDGPLLAVVDATNNELVIVDTETLEIAGTHAAPSGVTLMPQKLCFDHSGAKLYAGGADDGTLHRFDVDAASWDQATTIDSGGMLVLLDTSADGRYLWCSSFWSRKVFRIDLEPATPAASLVYTTPAGSLGPACGAVRNLDGSIVFPDPVNDVMRHVTSAGALAATWPLSIPGQGSQNVHGSVHLDEDEVRAFWTDDGVVGWAWIDSANVINATHSFFPDIPYGDVALTSNEGTLLALPDSGKVVQWPGGRTYIRPSKNHPGTYGSEHAHVTFTGAEAYLG